MQDDLLHANTRLVRTFIDEVWGKGRVDNLGAYLSPDYRDHAYTPADATGLANVVRTSFTAFPDQQCTIERVTAQDDIVVCALRMTGHHLGPFRGTPPTGSPIDVQVIRTYRVTGGRIAEHWGLLDTARLLRQIGAPLDPQHACAVPRPA